MNMIYSNLFASICSKLLVLSFFHVILLPCLSVCYVGFSCLWYFFLEFYGIFAEIFTSLKLLILHIIQVEFFLPFIVLSTNKVQSFKALTFNHSILWNYKEEWFECMHKNSSEVILIQETCRQNTVAPNTVVVWKYNRVKKIKMSTADLTVRKIID